ncbi:MAG TPA: FAD binding domain-containing protein [Gaiellaceae bacterium]|nr:FAD binding domain-containing protein [Gaiellaceae bacterium]
MDAFLPRSLDEALALRAEHPEAVPVAGGTDLWVEINFGRTRPPAILDLSRVEELKTWEAANGRVRLGAGVTFARIERELAAFRPLAEAARSVGSPQIRNRATIGGNLGTASPAGDSIPVLAAYGAGIVLASAAGTRTEPWDAFFTGPKRTTLAPDELIAGVEWDRLDAPGSFAKVGTRNAMVIAIAGLCLQLDPSARTVRLALGSVAPTVVRAPEAEAFAAGAVAWDEPDRPLSEAAVAEFGRHAAAAATPIDDVRGSAAYRRHAVEVLARRALQWTVDDWRAA